VIVLLDTHALIWSVADSPRLSNKTRSIIVDARNIVLASAVSAWEIAVKKAIGQLSVPDDLEGTVEAAAFTKRSITFADARRVSTLPPYHHDPFDRMLVAQALEDGVPIVSRDPQIACYPIQIIW